MTVIDDSEPDITVCRRQKGNDDGDEPSETGSGPDGTHCLYDFPGIPYPDRPVVPADMRPAALRG